MAIVTLGGGVSGCGTSLPEAERWHDARLQLWNWTPGRRGWILPQFAAVRSDRWWVRGGGSSSIPKVHSVSLVDVSLASLRVWVGEQVSTGACADLSNHSSEYSGPVGFGCPAGSLQRSHEQ